MIICIHGTDNTTQKEEDNMYKCIELGKENVVVEDNDAWEFAILHCFDKEMVDNFLLEFGEDIFADLNTSSLEEFKKEVVEWFFSGMWIHESDDPEEEFEEELNYDTEELVDWFNRHRLV